MPSVEESQKKARGAHVNTKRKEAGKPKLNKEQFKACPEIFTYFGGLEGVKMAATNAAKLLPKGTPKKPSLVKPSSNMHLLMKEIEELAKSQKST